jgi:hypothetical protein
MLTETESQWKTTLPANSCSHLHWFFVRMLAKRKTQIHFYSKNVLSKILAQIWNLWWCYHGTHAKILFYGHMSTP